MILSEYFVVIVWGSCEWSRTPLCILRLSPLVKNVNIPRHHNEQKAMFSHLTIKKFILNSFMFKLNRLYFGTLKRKSGEL